MSITQQAKDALAAVQGGRSREAVDIASGALKRIKDGEEASARVVVMLHLVSGLANSNLGAFDEGERHYREALALRAGDENQALHGLFELYKKALAAPAAAEEAEQDAARSAPRNRKAAAAAAAAAASAQAKKPAAARRRDQYAQRLEETLKQLVVRCKGDKRWRQYVLELSEVLERSADAFRLDDRVEDAKGPRAPQNPLLEARDLLRQAADEKAPLTEERTARERQQREHAQILQRLIDVQERLEREEFRSEFALRSNRQIAQYRQRVEEERKSGRRSGSVAAEGLSALQDEKERLQAEVAKAAADEEDLRVRVAAKLRQTLLKRNELDELYRRALDDQIAAFARPAVNERLLVRLLQRAEAATSEQEYAELQGALVTEAAAMLRRFPYAPFAHLLCVRELERPLLAAVAGTLRQRPDWRPLFRAALRATHSCPSRAFGWSALGASLFLSSPAPAASWTVASSAFSAGSVSLQTQRKQTESSFGGAGGASDADRYALQRDAYESGTEDELPLLALCCLASLALRRGEPQSALEWVRRGLAEVEREATRTSRFDMRCAMAKQALELTLAEAYLALDNRHHAKAAALAERIAREDPRCWRAARVMAECALLRVPPQLDEAWAAYERLAAILRGADGAVDGDKCNLGDSELLAGRICMERFRRAIALGESEAGEWLDRALRHFETAKLLNDADPAAWLATGVALWEKGGEWRRVRDHAYRHFFEAARRDPSDDEALARLGHYFRDVEQRASQAHKCYAKALELRPASAQAGPAMLAALDDAGDRDSVAQLVDRALSVDPTCGWAWMARARLLRRARRLGRAVKAFQNALRVHPENAHGWEELAETYHEQGRFMSAVRSFQRAAEVHVDPVAQLRCRFLASRALSLLGLDEEALHTLEAAAGALGRMVVEHRAARAPDHPGHEKAGARRVGLLVVPMLAALGDALLKVAHAHRGAGALRLCGLETERARCIARALLGNVMPALGGAQGAPAIPLPADGPAPGTLCALRRLLAASCLLLAQLPSSSVAAAVDAAVDAALQPRAVSEDADSALCAAAGAEDARRRTLLAEARRALCALLALNPTDTSAWRDLAVVAYEERLVAESAASFGDDRKSDAESAKRRALAAAQCALLQDPTSGEAWALLGAVSDEKETQRRCFARAAQLGARAQGLQRLALLLLLREDRAEDALLALQAAHSVDPGDARLWAAYGLAYLRVPSQAAARLAEAAFFRAVELGHGMVAGVGLATGAVLTHTRARYDLSAFVLTRATRAAPRCASARLMLGLVAERRGQQAEAVRALVAAEALLRSGLSDELTAAALLGGVAERQQLRNTLLTAARENLVRVFAAWRDRSAASIRTLSQLPAPQSPAQLLLRAMARARTQQPSRDAGMALSEATTRLAREEPFAAQPLNADLLRQAALCAVETLLAAGAEGEAQSAAQTLSTALPRDETLLLGLVRLLPPAASAPFVRAMSPLCLGDRSRALLDARLSVLEREGGSRGEDDKAAASARRLRARGVMLSPPDSVQWNALARELLRGSPPHVEAVLGALRSGPTPSPARYLETQEAANERVELVCAAQLRCGLGDPGGSGGGSGEGWRDGGSAADAEALALGAGGGELEDSERPRAAWSLAAWCVHQDPTRPTAWRQFAAAAHSRAIVTAFERGVDSPAAQRALSSALLLLLETLPALSGVEDAQARIARVAVAVECLVLRARGDDLARAERLMESELKGAGGVTHRLAARLSLRRGDRATAVARYREAALAAAAAAPRAGEMRVVSVLEPLSERGAWVWMELAAVLSTEGDTEGARSALEQAVRAAESASCRTAALVRLAKLQYFTRQYRQGEEAVQAALALSPHDPVCLFVMGLFHRKAKRWADAVQCFERALQCTADAPLVSTTRPRVPLANLQLALCHGKQKDMDVAVAEEDLLFELEVSPRLPAAHYQLALLALRRLQESFPGGRPVSGGGGGGEAATLAAAAEDYESIHASARRSLAVAAHLAPVGAVLWRQLSSVWSRAE